MICCRPPISLLFMFYFQDCILWLFICLFIYVICFHLLFWPFCCVNLMLWVYTYHKSLREKDPCRRFVCNADCNCFAVLVASVVIILRWSVSISFEAIDAARVWQRWGKFSLSWDQSFAKPCTEFWASFHENLCRPSCSYDRCVCDVPWILCTSQALQ